MTKRAQKRIAVKYYILPLQFVAFDISLFETLNIRIPARMSARLMDESKDPSIKP